MKKLLLIVALSAAVTACSSEPMPAQPLQVGGDKIPIAVKNINVLNRGKEVASKPPYVDSQYSPTLNDAVLQWVMNRLIATGPEGTATLVIAEADVKEQPLTTKEGVEGWFTRDQAAKYIGRAEMTLEAHVPSTGASGYAQAHAVHTVTLPEDPSEIEKNNAYRSLVDGLMKDLNANMEQAIREHMSSLSGKAE